MVLCRSQLSTVGSWGRGCWNKGFKTSKTSRSAFQTLFTTLFPGMGIFWVAVAMPSLASICCDTPLQTRSSFCADVHSPGLGVGFPMNERSQDMSCSNHKLVSDGKKNIFTPKNSESIMVAPRASKKPQAHSKRAPPHHRCPFWLVCSKSRW